MIDSTAPMPTSDPGAPVLNEQGIGRMENEG